ncbi:MAG: porin family protein [Spirochaetaceae bacterium]|jgi:hypothetical protein|nr:porin family protein [Spirochaetaceae bacterium]
MKKALSILTVAVVLTTAVWTQDVDFSVGGGGLLVNDFSGGAKKGDDIISYPYLGFGGFVYLDATYAELSVGFLVGNGTVIKSSNIVNKTPWTLSSINMGLLAKYPLDLSDALMLFPALGIEYQMFLSAKRDGTEVDEPDDFSAFWIKIGGGIDFHFTRNIYVRGEALFGIRLANKVEKDLADSMKGDTLFGLGPTVKLGAGYMF